MRARRLQITTKVCVRASVRLYGSEIFIDIPIRSRVRSGERRELQLCRASVDDFNEFIMKLPKSVDGAHGRAKRNKTAALVV
jgi:hypothetical protein